MSYPSLHGYPPAHASLGFPILAAIGTGRAIYGRVAKAARRRHIRSAAPTPGGAVPAIEVPVQAIGPAPPSAAGAMMPAGAANMVQRFGIPVAIGLAALLFLPRLLRRGR